MIKLDGKGKILVSIGIILLSIGIIMLGFAISVPSVPLLSFIVYIILPIGVGIGMVLLPIIKKNKNSKLDFEQRKNNQHSDSIKNLMDADKKTTTSETKLNRPCKVCKTQIPHGVKSCPGCGDIYS